MSEYRSSQGLRSQILTCPTCRSLSTRSSSSLMGGLHVPARTLEAQDEFVQLKSAQILTILLSSETTPLQHQHLQPFLRVLASLVQGQSPNKRDVAVQCLEALLARPDCRRAVWAIPGIIAGYVESLYFIHLSSLPQIGGNPSSQTNPTNELPSHILLVALNV